MKIIECEKNWYSCDIKSHKYFWSYALKELEKQALLDISEAVKSNEKKFLSLAPRKIVTPFELNSLVSSIQENIYKGIGFLIIRGVPLLNSDISSAIYLLLGFGNILGVPVPQTFNSNLISHVRDEQNLNLNPNNRGHKTNNYLPFHSDRCDIGILACISQAKKGGETILVDNVSAHNELLKKDINVLKELYSFLPQDRRGDYSDSQNRWYSLPIYSQFNGRLVTRYIRKFIESSQIYDDAPRLTSNQILALDRLDEVLNDPKLYFPIKLEQGDLLIFNNYRVLHSRNKFQDCNNMNEVRHLIRVWVSNPNLLTLPNYYTEFMGPYLEEFGRGGYRSIKNKLCVQ